MTLSLGVRLLTASEAAAYLRVSVWVVQAMTRDGR